MRLALIVNPVAGGGKSWRKLRRHFKNWSHEEWELDVHLTRCPGHAGAIVHELLERPPDVLCVCGGDGTLNEVISEVPDPAFPVALVPAGTANVLARELGLPLHPVHALGIALEGVVRRIDLGILDARSPRRFLLMAGIGFDAQVIWKCNRRFKRMLGVLAYYYAAFRCMLTYGFPEFELTTESETLSATSCVIANARSYGGGLVLTPEADISDGALDIIALENVPRTEYLRFLISAWRGRPRTYPWLRRLRARTIRVHGPRGIWAQVDGELAGTLPVEISVAPGSFPILVAPPGKGIL